MKKPVALRNFRSLARMLEAVSPEPEAEAREIYFHLGLNLLDPLPEGLDPWLSELVQRRRRGEPLAYILGHRAFLDLDLEVTPAVLIPRPETEVLALMALERARRWSAPEVADVGTGSGALALYLARHHPAARVVATDLSAEALRVARRNARRLGIAGVHWVQADLLSGFGTAGLHLVVSNPPYVSETEYANLPRELHHEPRGALVAGRRGLELQEALLRQALRVLRPGGLILLELAPFQAARLREKARSLGYRRVHIHPDLSGRPRVLEAWR